MEKLDCKSVSANFKKFLEVSSDYTRSSFFCKIFSFYLLYTSEFKFNNNLSLS